MVRRRLCIIVRLFDSIGETHKVWRLAGKILVVMFAIATSKIVLATTPSGMLANRAQEWRCSHAHTSTYTCWSAGLSWKTPAANEIGTFRVSSVVPTMLLLRSRHEFVSQRETHTHSPTSSAGAIKGRTGS